MLRISSIIGSTRRGQKGRPFAKWVYEIAQKRSDGRCGAARDKGRTELMSRLDCLLAATIILAAALNASGTQLAAGRLQGEVTGIGADGMPFNIPGASLDLKTAPTGPPTASVLSDKQAKYSIIKLSPGPHTLEVSFPGFKTVDKTVTNTTRSTETE